MALYQALIKQGDVIIDAGANIGLYSILGSRIVGEKGKVYSFEPSGANFDILKKNIQLNKCNNIVPVNMGLGDKTGEILELFQEEGSGDAEKYVFRSSINETAVSAPDSKVMHVSEKISLETLDNFRSKMNLSKIDFLKIDVEGFEYFLLKGAENALKENPGMIILFECASHLAERAGVTKAEVLQFLEGLGFEIFYWNAIDKTWSDDAAGVWASGQLLAGRNLLDRIRSIKV
ncbi:MAG: FkbM family methyltransferase [Bacteroidota bacterium]|nr:FkbM family methyltransferase [Bacteroidota bacterium]